jgi:hypothetical protein
MKAFLLIEEICAAKQNEKWEDEGGRRRECLDAENVVDRELKLHLWETGPYEVDEDEPPDWVKRDPHELARWDKAVALRRAMLAAIEAAKR